VVRIANLVPGGDYVPMVRVGRHRTEPLALPNEGTREAESVVETMVPALSGEDDTSGCQALRNAMDALAAYPDEKTVAARANALRNMGEWAHCSSDEVRNRFDELLLKMNRFSGELTVNRGEYIHLVLARTDITRRWAQVWDAGPAGEWRTTYGFSFIQYVFFTDRRFFLRPSADGTAFTVTREHQRSVMEFAPTVFFTWRDAGRRGDDLDIGPTVGLGFDFERPTVSFGASFAYRENISLNAGVVMHQVHRLNGQFKEGDTIKENLTFDALHQTVYRPNPFIAVSIRSLSNPFARPTDR
jgi:hypothetical protein